MTMPATYLHVAPSESSADSLGSAIDARVMIKKLQKLNGRISFMQQFGDVWYPGKATGGTCMWLGEPGGRSVKITAFNMGQVPEFTLLAADGNIILKGWRAIFDRVIRVAKVKRADIERAFSITLEAGEEDRICQQCVRSHGKIIKVYGKDLLCNFHLGVRRVVNLQLDKQGEQVYQRKVQGKAPAESVTTPKSRFGQELMIICP